MYSWRMYGGLFLFERQCEKRYARGSDKFLIYDIFNQGMQIQNDKAGAYMYLCCCNLVRCDATGILECVAAYDIYSVIHYELSYLTCVYGI